MVFTSKAEQSRHKEIDRTMTTAASLLGELEVLNGLKPHPGRFQNLLASLYVPNLRGDRLVTPRKNNNGTSIAIFSLKQGESVNVNRQMTTMHDDQVEVISNAFNQMVVPVEGDDPLDMARQELDLAFNSYPRVERPTQSHEDEVRDQTLVLSAELSIGSLVRIIKGRPMIFLASSTTMGDRGSGLSLIHQLAHADQKLRTIPPIKTDTTKAHKVEELEARRITDIVSIASLRRHPSSRYQ